MKHILVAGAGIVGISTGLWLQRMGYEVTIVDRTGPASETSYGNAGVIAATAYVPVTTPDKWIEGPKMAINPRKPLFIRWKYLPRLLPFFARYMSHANQKSVAEISKAMSELLYDAFEQHQVLAADTKAAQYISNHDFCYGYKTHAKFLSEKADWELKKANGGIFKVYTNQEFSKIDPAYDGKFETIVACKENGRISDPGAYVSALAENFVANGGKLVISDILKIETHENSATAIHTSKGKMNADGFVIALGPWSAELCKPLGLTIPMEAERGYHIELTNPSYMPKSTMMVSEGKFAVTPMKGRLRFAGTVEFAKLDAKPGRKSLDLLKSFITKLFPDMEYDEIVEWMGQRPSTDDSKPVIGSHPHYSNVYLGFGHQHLGLTAGPKTGRLIASLIDKKKPNLDLKPFLPNRYF